MKNNTVNNNGSYFLNIHVLQTMPPSCANRDDTGTPKTAVYGGVNRGRISSQCIKKNIRDNFSGDVVREKSIRTVAFDKNNKVKEEYKNLFKEVYDEKYPNSIDDNFDIVIQNVVDICGIGKALFPIGAREIEGISTVIYDNYDLICAYKGDEKEKKYLLKLFKEVLLNNPPIDVVLFGRMLAGKNCEYGSVEACCQVAHSLSTHEVSTQYDYFTAVDDIKEENGSSMLGVLEFQSYTMYKFANINVNELYDAYPELAPEALRQFLRLFATQVPSGKQNTYANVTYPCMFYVTLDRRNISLADTFEEPIVSDNGYAKESVNRFIESANRKYKTFLPAPIFAFGVDEFGLFDEEFVQKTGHLEDVIDSIVESVNELV